MAPLAFLFLAAWAGAADPAGPSIDKASCGDAQAKKIEDAWPEARRRVKAARDAVDRAVTGEDPAQRGKIAGHAKRMLGVEAGDLPDVGRILGLMDGIIGKSHYVCGAKADKHCGSRGGYVRRGEQIDGREVVHLCPPLFKEGAREQLVRTMTHESAHLVDPNISQPEGEGYCIVFDCDTPCPGKTAFLVADNWAHFTHCAGGRKPDADFVIKGDPGPPVKGRP